MLIELGSEKAKEMLLNGAYSMARLRNLEETFQNEIGFAPSCRCYLEDDIEEEKNERRNKKRSRI